MRMRGKVDSNQKAIVEAFRKCGCSVLILSNVGAGCPDIAVGHRGVTYFVEIKSKAGKLTEDQKTFHLAWRGARIHIVRSVDEVFTTVNDWTVVRDHMDAYLRDGYSGLV